MRKSLKRTEARKLGRISFLKRVFKSALRISPISEDAKYLKAKYFQSSFFFERLWSKKFEKQIDSSKPSLKIGMTKV